MQSWLGEIAAAMAAGESLSSAQREALVEDARAPEGRAARGLLLLLAEDDPAIIESWYRARGADSLRELDAPLELSMAVSLEEESVEEQIDALFAGEDPGAVAEAILRRQLAWSHPRLEELLGSERPQIVRAAAALLLVSGDEAMVFDVLENGGEPDAIVGILEGALPLLPLVAPLEELLIELVDSFEPDDDEEEAWSRRLQALLFAADPRAFSRRVMSGQIKLEEVLADPAALRPALGHLALPSWLEVVALLERSGEAGSTERFQLAALLALVSAAAFARASEESEEESIDPQALLEALQPPELPEKGLNQWANQQAVELGLELVVGLSQEGQEQLLLEIAAQEMLVGLGVPGPGIVGLPLSSEQEDGIDEELARAQLLVEELPEQMGAEEALALIRTMCDLRRWALQRPGRFEVLAAEVGRRWMVHEDAAIALAAGRLQVAPSLGDQLEAARGDDLWSLLALRSLAERGPEALDALAQLWEEASWPWMMLVEDAMFEAVQRAGAELAPEA